MMTKILLFLFAAFVIWPCVEYNAHRNELHGEENLPEDPTGKVQSALFEKHIYHHVYMNIKFALPLHFIIFRLGLLYPPFYYAIGHIPSQSLLAGGLHGLMLYDFFHYSYHSLDLKFPFAWMQNWYDELKHSHMVHHYRDNNKGFGVTNLLLDRLFGTAHTTMVSKDKHKTQ